MDAIRGGSADEGKLQLIHFNPIASIPCFDRLAEGKGGKMLTLAEAREVLRLQVRHPAHNQRGRRAVAAGLLEGAGAQSPSRKRLDSCCGAATRGLCARGKTAGSQLWERCP